MLPVRLLTKILFVSLLVFSAGNRFAFAQNVSRLNGIVVDQNGGLIAGVEITILNSSGTLERTVLTDSEGFFDFPYLPPDEYSLKISKTGFDASEIPSLFVEEENARQLKIELKINPLSETIKVESEPAETDENKVGLTPLDQKLLEDFPLNGRNFQSLINLVPGVVFTPVNNKNLGQFSSNGQRTNANYFTVDGVSANFGTTNYDFLGQTGSGSIPSMNIQGGLDNLISTEAVQEVTIQTLDFAPATGKMPGANISFVSKSGGSDFSFSAFENFRSGAFNAKDYFDIEKPPHSFNNFGGYFGGPLFFPDRKQNSNNRTFFFLSFEGKKFTLPQPTIVMGVPSLDIRKDTSNEVAQSIYNSFPLPNETDNPPATPPIETDSPNTPSTANAFFPETEPFRATYSDPNSSENYNLRIDHIFNSKISFFGRFNYSPSSSENRNPENLSSFISSKQITRTFTFGSTQAFSSKIVNEFRFNLSRQSGQTNHDFDGRYGGILPDTSIFIPKAFEQDKTHFRFSLNGLPDSLTFFYGNYSQNEMRQLVFSDSLSYSTGNHEIKFGFDYRNLSPTLRTSGYGINYDFNSAEAILVGTANRVSFFKNPNVNTNVLSVSSFIQDNWKVNSRLSLIYGLRWEINPAPSTGEKEGLLTLENAPDLSQTDQTALRLAPEGTPYYQTSYKNFAPRFGAAFQIFSKNDKQLVLRGGAGTFYDLGQSQFNEIASPLRHTNEFAENLILPINDFPFGFPSSDAEPNKRPTVISTVSGYQLPRTYFWNLGISLKIGNNLFSTSYVGGAGRKLQRTLTLNMMKSGGNTPGYFSNSFSKIIYIDNAYSSDYQSFQFQYSRNLSSGFKSFVNYAWAHSIDNNSSDSNITTPFLNYPVSADRGNSDFDVRHIFNAGFSYDLPQVKSNGLIGRFLKNWTLGGVFFARTGLPYDVKIAELNPLSNDFDLRRADFNNSLPLFVKSSESPTGFRLNADAFTKPAEPVAQGTLGRNVFTGPSVWQFDSSLGRKFNLTQKLQLQMRVEVYNVFNRPNFSNPETKILYQSEERIITKSFGVPTKTMARGYASAEPTGGVSPIFQLGGARIIQFNLRIKF
jgi:hypothetical protein